MKKKEKNIKNKSVDRVIKHHHTELSLSFSLSQYCIARKVTSARIPNSWSLSGHPNETCWPGLQKCSAMTSVTVLSMSNELNLPFKLLCTHMKKNNKTLSCHPRRMNITENVY